MGRLTQATTTYSFIGKTSYTVKYSYDAGSNLTGMTDPQSGGTTYVYDTLHRMSSLTSPQCQVAVTYDPLNRPTKLTPPNALNTTYSYDAVSNLLSVLHQKGDSTLDG